MDESVSKLRNAVLSGMAAPAIVAVIGAAGLCQEATGGIAVAPCWLLAALCGLYAAMRPSAAAGIAALGFALLAVSGRMRPFLLDDGKMSILFSAIAILIGGGTAFLAIQARCNEIFQQTSAPIKLGHLLASNPTRPFVAGVVLALMLASMHLLINYCSDAWRAAAVLIVVPASGMLLFGDKALWTAARQLEPHLPGGLLNLTVGSLSLVVLYVLPLELPWNGPVWLMLARLIAAVGIRLPITLLILAVAVAPSLVELTRLPAIGQRLAEEEAAASGSEAIEALRRAFHE
jgi:hypothetical protein